MSAEVIKLSGAAFCLTPPIGELLVRGAHDFRQRDLEIVCWDYFKLAQHVTNKQTTKKLYLPYFLLSEMLE